mgnify:CR=1 FL=1|tara:strand:+ start:1838 stop:2299 length:462 start_codon:yes stop_codon:yes gene_type:complete
MISNKFRRTLISPDAYPKNQWLVGVLPNSWSKPPLPTDKTWGRGNVKYIILQIMGRNYAGCYGGLSRYSAVPIKGLSGIRSLLMSLGTVWSGEILCSWLNTPSAPPFRNSLKKILKNLSNSKHREGAYQWHTAKENRMHKWLCYLSLNFKSNS